MTKRPTFWFVLGASAVFWIATSGFGSSQGVANEPQGDDAAILESLPPARPTTVDGRLAELEKDVNRLREQVRRLAMRDVRLRAKLSRASELVEREERRPTPIELPASR